MNLPAIALFDLKTDSGETKNLANDRPDDVKRLQALYQTWAATHQATPWGRGVNAKGDDGGAQDNKTPKNKRREKN